MRVRQALAMAINRYEITRFVMKAGQIQYWYAIIEEYNNLDQQPKLRWT